MTTSTPVARPSDHAHLRSLRAALRRDGSFVFIHLRSRTGAVFVAERGVPHPIQQLTLGDADALSSEGLLVETSRSERGIRYRTPGAAGPAKPGKRDRPARTAADRRKSKFLQAEKFFKTRPDAEPEALKVNLGESPLGWLSKRRDAHGRPFLDPAEVDAGERLRADFERAQLGPSVTQDWRRFLTAGCEAGAAGGADSTPEGGATAARMRVLAALDELGPGLGDAAFRTCCFLEGLEQVEKSLNWSARSGKVVLKLALQRLAAHYEMADRPKHRQNMISSNCEGVDAVQ